MELQLKLYDWTWIFKKQLNPKDVYSDVAFQEELNSGQGDLSLRINWELSDFQTTDIIEIRSSDNWDLYTWILEEIDIVEYQDSSVLELKFYGVFTALNDMIYKSSWSRAFSKSDTAWNIIKDIIDSFNTDYGALFWDTQILDTNLLRYTASSIDITWTTLSIDFDNQSCLDSIRKVLENTWFDFYIWVDWVVYVVDIANQDTKYITFEKEILNINRTITKKNMVNKYYLARSGWTYKIYEDTPNQTTYWLKEKSQSDSSIANETTQDIKWNNFISEHKEEENIVSIRIKPNSIDLTPWNLITTQNSRNNLVEKQITKIEKRKAFRDLYLWDFISFGKTIVKDT